MSRDPRAEAIDIVESAFGPKGWDFARRRVWLEAVLDVESEAVMRGARELVRDWDMARPPVPGNLRGYALKHQRISRTRASRSEEWPRLDMSEIADRAEAEGNLVTAEAIRRAVASLRT